MSTSAHTYNITRTIRIEFQFGLAAVVAIASEADPLSREPPTGLLSAEAHHSVMDVQFTAVFREVPEAYIGFVEELPGANTQGATLDEARANLRRRSR